MRNLLDLDDLDNLDNKYNHLPLPNPYVMTNTNTNTNCKGQITNDLRRRIRAARNKWTIKKKSNNILDWWDRNTLQQQIITSGSGKFPRCGDRIKITYVIKNIKGMALDWSRKPFIFYLGDPKIILGLQQGISNMQVGETSKLYIPSGLAYGCFGLDNIIPPYTDIIVKVDFLKIFKH